MKKKINSKQTKGEIVETTKEPRSIIKYIVYPVIAGVLITVITFLIIGNKNNNNNSDTSEIEEIKKIYVTASVDNSYPPQYSTVLLTVTVKDQNNKAVPGASIEATEHYSSKDTRKTSHTDDYGEAKIPFKIGPATVDFDVIIDVRVRKDRIVKSTKTSFTPVAKKE